MKEFIYEKGETLTKEYCDEIIKFFEDNVEMQHIGMVGNKNNEYAYKKNVKKTTDLTLHVKDINNPNKKYSSLFQPLIKVLIANLKIYFSDARKLNIHMNLHNISIEMFLIHKYKQNEGKFEYHTDFALNDDFNKYRILNFLWYLNDVECGGETEFFGNYRIKPETGKLVFFPSEWFFPHSGKIPLSNNKYVIAGWFFIDSLE